MTPNQINGIAETVRQLLGYGTGLGWTPDHRAACVRVLDTGTAYRVVAYWTTQTGRETTTDADLPYAPTIPPAVLTDCVVCGGLGCEHCPKVVA